MLQAKNLQGKYDVHQEKRSVRGRCVVRVCGLGVCEDKTRSDILIQPKKEGAGCTKSQGPSFPRPLFALFVFNTPSRPITSQHGDCPPCPFIPLSFLLSSFLIFVSSLLFISISISPSLSSFLNLFLFLFLILLLLLNFTAHDNPFLAHCRRPIFSIDGPHSTDTDHLSPHSTTAFHEEQ